MSERLIIWDFDGTLAYRDGGMWSATLAEVVNAAGLVPRMLAASAFVPFLATGFPWHRHDIVHPHLDSAGQWWDHVAEEVLLAALHGGAKLPPHAAKALLPAIRSTYTDPARWRVFPDAAACLDALTARGWTHRILSNHVPELGALVDALGLRRHFEAVHTSAVIGYEKPHPAAYAIALAGTAPGDAWMIGDSVEADVLGAARHGIRGVLVRKDSDAVEWSLPDLAGLPALIGHHVEVAS
jgi:putative hydrolase of the HAD superfamily